MKAMILAGGLSTRLYPLTKSVPKPLVPVANVPNAVHVMRYLRSHGVSDIAINVHYHAAMIRQALGDGSAYGVRLEYLEEAALLGSAGAVKQMESFFDSTFAVVGCDDLTDIDLERLVAFHREREALATIALVSAPDVTQYGVVVVDARGRIVEFQEKPAPGTEKSNLVNTGVYVFEPGIFGRIAAGAFVDFGKDVFPALQRENAAFYALEMRDAYWCDIGTPSEYRRATEDVLDRRITLLGDAPGVGDLSHASLGAGVQIEGSVIAGTGVTIGAGAQLCGPTVLGNNASVGENAIVERAILWDGASVGSGARVTDSILGRGYAVEDGDTVEGEILANEDGTKR
ncbi:MAG: NDP-sugar synthase [Candidatus Eremiobacteraeota bacterium]|nr:NDP-sugar synthase [Candidatus Eremiobacteraeota bacterium]